MFLPHHPQPMSAVRCLAAVSWPRMYGALANERAVVWRKARRFMLFFAQVESDYIAAGVPAIHQSVGEDRRGPAFAIEHLCAGGWFEPLGGNGGDREFASC